MFRRALILLQIATRPVSVLAVVGILVFQYVGLPLLAIRDHAHVPYMSDVVACALVTKVIAYFIGRTAEKLKGASDVRTA